jgi:hypothetical protein
MNNNLNDNKLDRADEINLTIGTVILIVGAFISLAHYFHNQGL